MSHVATELTFDEEQHVYRYRGAVVPSVTEIMGPLFNFGMVPGATWEYASDRGTKVHEACSLFVLDLLDEEALDPALVPYVDAFRTFLKVSRFACQYSEFRLHHATLGYAGTADLFGSFDRRRLACVDIKTVATLSPVTGIQLAAYSAAWDVGMPAGTRVKERYALQLRGDGTYRLHPYTRADDLACFKGLLALYRWNENKGRKN